MKYRELHKKIQTIGCYPVKGQQIAGGEGFFPLL